MKPSRQNLTDAPAISKLSSSAMIDIKDHLKGPGRDKIGP